MVKRRERKPMGASRNRFQLLVLMACAIVATMAITDSAMAGT
jgi:hypothetical protein